MSQSKEHDKCRHFSYKKCPHRDDEIMKQATQTIPEYHGGKIPVMSFPPKEAVDKICADCDMFAEK